MPSPADECEPNIIELFIVLTKYAVDLGYNLDAVITTLYQTTFLENDYKSRGRKR